MCGLQRCLRLLLALHHQHRIPMAMVLLLHIHLPSFRNPLTTAHRPGRLVRSKIAKELKHREPLLGDLQTESAETWYPSPC